MDSQTIIIKNRNLIDITNVDKLISFTTNEFLMATPLGNLKINGKDLSISRMDTDKKELSIIGRIDSTIYLGNMNSREDKKENVFSKLFK